MSKEQSKKIEEKFTLKYLNNSWLGTESKSGPGSSLLVNEKLLTLIKEFSKENDIKIIVDCGCGDFNWMKMFDFNLIEKYIGIDIVQPLIEENNKKFSNNKISFLKSDIVFEKVPYGDILFCKDCLFHLSFEHTLKALENFRDSKSKFLISTTFFDFENIDIVSGNWRPINLEEKPFCLGKPELLWKNIENKKNKFISKSIGIWRL